MTYFAPRPAFGFFILISRIVFSNAWAEPASSSIDPPTFVDVAYGPHERHSLDLWQAQGDGRRPVVVFIHGGGWNGGGKADIPKKLLSTMLENRISVASINYRYTSMALIPGPLHDAARAVQFLRTQADTWNLDRDRIGAYGVSAGGCSAMWLAFHDDLMDSKSLDPVLRQSTRLRVAVGISPQTSLEPDELVDWVGEEGLKHPMIHRAIGFKKGDDPAQLYEKWRPMLRECSPIRHITSDDPPTMFEFPRFDALPAVNPGSAIHHALFGMKVKEKADALPLECMMRIQATANESSITPETFLIKHLIVNPTTSTR
jgi:arylformamidase